MLGMCVSMHVCLHMQHGADDVGVRTSPHFGQVVMGPSVPTLALQHFPLQPASSPLLLGQSQVAQSPPRWNPLSQDR